MKSRKLIFYYHFDFFFFKYFSRIFIIWTLVFLFNEVHSQHQNDNWYFGDGAGISFSSGSPVSLSNGQIFTTEGVASISDRNGSLLFYTDGVSVWDKDHIMMTNGSNLGGNNTSTQSALVLPLPGSPNIYYLFTVGPNNGSFMYSVIDMNLRWGLGDVTIKNVLILSNVSEKLCAIKNSTLSGFWIIVHRGNNNEFDVFSLTSAGFNNIPIVSLIGTSYTGIDYTGYLKGSPLSNKLVAALGGHNYFEIYDFDNSLGNISNPFNTPVYSATDPAYGVEFSLSGQYLYTSLGYPGQIRQYDLFAGSNSAIISSEVQLNVGNSVWHGALQRAPNGKIYVARDGLNSLGVINQPNSQGLSCNWVGTGFTFNNGACNLGLPNFQTDNFVGDSYYKNVCFGDSTHFYFSPNPLIGGISWNFGDSLTGMNNFSYLLNPIHLFSDTGIYKIELIKYYLSGAIDTTLFEIQIYPVPNPSLGNDTILCSGSSILLSPGIAYMDYLWQNGNNGSSLVVSTQGIYSIKVSDGHCIASDTILVSFSSCLLPIANFSSSDTSFCDKKCIDFYDQSSNAPSSWFLSFPGSATPASTQQNPVGICYNSFGSFDVSLVACNNLGCDTLYMHEFINEYQLPPTPVISQSGNILTSTAAYSYQWYIGGNNIAGANAQSYVVSQPGLYYVIISDSLGCMTSSASVVITDVSDQELFESLQIMKISSGHWKLKFPNLNMDSVIFVNLYDLGGRIIFKDRVNIGSHNSHYYNVNLEDHAKGLFILNIENGHNKHWIKLLN